MVVRSQVFISGLVKCGLLISLLILCFCAPLLMKHFTQGFHLARFELGLARQPEWEVDSLTASEKEMVCEILSQPYTYLNRGAQCFVFQSRDGHFVIKLFHVNRQATPFSKWKKKKGGRTHWENKKLDFSACLIAYNLARIETALLYVHLNPTEGKLPELAIKDPIGRPYSLKLDRYSFVIQKKVSPFAKTLLTASSEGNLSPYLDSYFALLKSRASKGICNEDASVASNFGFLGTEAVEIDFGHYVYRPDLALDEFIRFEMNRFLQSLRHFIEKNIPDQLSLFEQKAASL